MEHRVCNSSTEGAAESVASGKWPRSTQKGTVVFALEWFYQKLLIAVEVITSSNVNVGGAHRSHYLRGCVSVFGHKTACVFALVFSVFLVT